ncbi:hypothetical protein [Nesterenkonia sp. K-15-9-6]|uniref:hypothetical protein n=1 Tax=Nesterenkonia sp. K-15-9-6 TaxID=3093918 RepID=UPI004044278C
MTTTAQKLDRARKRLAVLDAQWESTGLPRDPGALSGVKGYTRDRQVKDIKRSTRIASESVRLREEIRALEHRISHEQAEAEANEAATVDLERLRPGDLIRYRSHGQSVGNWLRVKRVNAKTVTCQESGPGMDPPRIPHDRIVETRHQEDAP